MTNEQKLVNRLGFLGPFLLKLKKYLQAWYDNTYRSTLHPFSISVYKYSQLMLTYSRECFHDQCKRHTNNHWKNTTRNITTRPKKHRKRWTQQTKNDPLTFPSDDLYRDCISGTALPASLRRWSSVWTAPVTRRHRTRTRSGKFSSQRWIQNVLNQCLHLPMVARFCRKSKPGWRWLLCSGGHICPDFPASECAPCPGTSGRVFQCLKHNF